MINRQERHILLRNISKVKQLLFFWSWWWENIIDCFLHHIISLKNVIQF